VSQFGGRLYVAITFWLALPPLWLLVCGLSVRPAHAQTPGAEMVEVVAIIRSAAEQHGVSPDLMECIADAESDFRPWVTSPGGHHAGLFQWSRRTWEWVAPLAGYSADWTLAYDPWLASDLAAWLMARPHLGGVRHWSTAWACGASGARW